jgi:drug/metabolite transporter (DMT)-like permease
VIAIIGGLGAAIMWAAATLASSRSSRMIGSRVVLAWIMIVGTVVGLPLALASGVPTEVEPDVWLLLLIAGASYSGGLYAAYRALTIGKVSIVAPIVATEGALAAVLAILLGDALALGSIAVLFVIATGVVLSSMEPARPDVMAGDIELTADAIEGPAPAAGSYAASAEPAHTDTRQAVLL